METILALIALLSELKSLELSSSAYEPHLRSKISAAHMLPRIGFCETAVVAVSAISAAYHFLQRFGISSTAYTDL
jgi:hypothetical protein